MPYGEANIWWPVADALRHGAGIRSSDPTDKAIELARTSVSIALGEDASPAEVDLRPPGPALPHGLRVRAAGDRSGPRPRGGHLGGGHLRRAVLGCTVRWSWCCPTCTGPTTSCSSSSTRCSTGCRAGSSWCWPPPARRWRSGGTRPTAGTTSSSSPSTRSRSDSAEALLCELAGADLGAGLSQGAARSQRRQPVLPGGARHPPVRRGHGRRTLAIPTTRTTSSCPTPSAASSPRGSTASPPTSGACSTTVRCSAAAVR